MKAAAVPGGDRGPKTADSGAGVRQTPRAGFRAYTLPSPRVNRILPEMNAVRATVRARSGADGRRPPAFLEVAHEMIHGMPEFEAVGEVISGADAMVAADASTLTSS